MGTQGRTTTESSLTSIPDYTVEEKKKIAAGMWSLHCPKCEGFWVRDYDFPVRRCPFCNHRKPWADPLLAENSKNPVAVGLSYII